MTEAADCATIKMGAEETRKNGQREAARSMGTSKMQFQEDAEPSTSNDVDFEEEAKCPYCHTVKDPSFGHYRSGSSGLKKGAVIWRYRCSMRQCAQFFGPFYRYNSRENSFDIISEDDPKVEVEETSQAAGGNEIDTTNDGEEEDTKLVDIEPVDGENAEEMNEQAEGEETEAETTNEVVEENDTVQEVFGLEVETEEEQIEIKPRKSLRCTTNRKKTGVYANANQEKKNHNDTKNEVLTKKLRKGYIRESIPLKSDEQETKARPVSIKTEPASTTKKPLKRKHEQTELVQPQLPKAPKTVERERERTRIATRSSGTQTGDAEHVAAASLQELIQMEASLTCGTTKSGTDNVDMDVSNSVKIPGHITRRMLIGKMIVVKQKTKIASLEEENAKLKEMICKFREAFFEIKNLHVEAMRHLKDDVIFLKREFQFHHDEMVAECKRSLNATKKEKEDTRKKCEVVQQQNDSLKSLLETREERVDMERKRADELARQILLKERDQHLAEVERDEANGKLADSLFLANNVKCAHCVNSTKMKEILTLQVKEKTIQAQQAMNERNDMRRKLENAEKISQILHKDRAKFEYEAKTWKSSCDKLRSTLSERQSADPQSFAPPCAIDPTPQPRPSTPASTSTPSIDTPSQQSSANGNENPSATPQPNAAAGAVTDDSPPEDGEISNSPMTAVSSKSRSPEYKLPPPPRPPTVKNGQDKWSPAVCASSLPSGNKPLNPPLPHINQSNKSLYVNNQIPVHKASPSSSSQFVSNWNDFPHDNLMAHTFSSKQQKKLAKFEKRRMKELEKAAYLSSQTDEGGKDKTPREAEKRREEYVQPPAKKLARLPPKPMAGTAKPAPGPSLAMPRIPRKSETEARKREENERKIEEEKRWKEEEEANRKIEAADWKEQMTKHKGIMNNSSKQSTYNGPVWNKEGAKRSGPIPSKDRAREGRESMHRHSPPSTSKSIPAFDLANSPLPWHVNSSPGPIEPRPQPQMPFNAWTAREESWSRSRDPTGWTNTDSWTPELSGWGNWGGARPTNGPGPGPAPFMQSGGMPGPPIYGHSHPQPNMFNHPTMNPHSLPPQLPPRPIVRRNFWDL